MLKIHLKDTPHNLTDDDFKALGEKLEGFSGSDCAVLVKDVLFEPVRKTKDATHFKNIDAGGKQMIEACSPGDKPNFETSLAKIAGEQQSPDTYIHQTYTHARLPYNF
jgi:vacuolar protein-sorting-associated protein 4